MSDILADEIQHATTMINLAVDSCRMSLLPEIGGYVPRLRKAAENHGFITEGTIEAMQLSRCAGDLHRMANALVHIRTALMDNAEKYPEEAA